MTSKHYKYFQPNDKDKKDEIVIVLFVLCVK